LGWRDGRAHVPDAQQRDTLLHRAGTQRSRSVDEWAPAPQRTARALRCVRGTRARHPRCRSPRRRGIQYAAASRLN